MAKGWFARVTGCLVRNVFHCDHKNMNDLPTNMTLIHKNLVAVSVEMTFGREAYI